MLTFIAVKYADLARFAGFGDYYLVKAELARTGNLYENAAVTYRGVSVGRVGEIHVEPDGVVADLKIDNTAPPIPPTPKPTSSTCPPSANSTSTCGPTRPASPT